MKNIFVIIIMLSGYVLAAQSERDTLSVNQVEIVKTFEAKLKDAKMIDLSPRIQEKTPVTKSYNYEITVVPVEIEYPDPIIRPLAMGADPQKNVDRFYAKLGYGTLNNLHGDLSYQLLNKDLFDLNVFGQIRSYDNTANIENHKATTTNLGLYGSYRLFDNTTLDIDVSGGQDYISLYDTLFLLDVVPGNNVRDREVFRTDARLNFSNVETSSLGFDYNFGLGIDYISSNDIGYNEVNYLTNLDISKHMSENVKVVLESDLYATTFDGSLDSVALSTINIKPGILYNNDIITASVKADLLMQNGNLSPFVEAEVGLAIFENQLQVYLGVDQEAVNHNLYNQYSDNRYISGNNIFDLKNSVSQKYYAGTRSLLFKTLSFDINLGYETIKDQAYYFSLRSLPTLSLTYYDATNFFIEGNLEIQATDDIVVGSTVSQNYFKTDNPIGALNMPTFLFNAYGKVNMLEDKLKLRADLQLGNQIKYRSNTGDAQEGNNLTQLDIEARYFPLEVLGLWVRANNIFNNNYLRYKGHPLMGRSFQGGIIVKF